MSRQLFDTGVASLLPNLVQSVCVAIAAVSIHRMVLFGENRLPWKVGRVELLFIALSAAVLFALMGFILSSAVLMLSSGDVSTRLGSALVILVGGVAMLVVSIRLSQLFPILVAEGHVSFARAWVSTRGNWWRLVVMNVLAFAPISTALSFINTAFLARPAPANIDEAGIRLLLQERIDGLFLLMAFNAVITVFTTALGVALLSYSYKKFNGRDFDEILLRPPAS